MRVRHLPTSFFPTTKLTTLEHEQISYSMSSVMCAIKTPLEISVLQGIILEDIKAIKKKRQPLA